MVASLNTKTNPSAYSAALKATTTTFLRTLPQIFLSALQTSHAFAKDSQSTSLALVFVTTAAMSTLCHKNITFSTIIGKIYDKMIVSMTETWYMSVLNKQEDHAVILDVGIGTAGALLKCKDIIKAKNLQIIGIDYNQFYVQAAKESIDTEEMSDYISVHALSIYDEVELFHIIEKYSRKRNAVRKEEEEEKDGDDDDDVDVDVNCGIEAKRSKDKDSVSISNSNSSYVCNGVDAVYFSGSFSLMPDPVGALTSVTKILDCTSASRAGGRIYITQTYQKRTPPLMAHVKPMLKYITTVDFGQLVTVEQIQEMLGGLGGKGLDLEEHEVIEGSLDNYWQAAYMSVLKANERQWWDEESVFEKSAETLKGSDSAE